MTNLRQNTNYQPIYLPKGTTKFNINENGFFDSIHLDEPRVIIQTDEYLELIQEDEIELFDIHFKFSDDLWDFSEKAGEFKEIATYKYSFHSIKSDEHKMLCKLFILNSLLDHGLHRPFIFYCLSRSKKFLNYLYLNCINIEDLEANQLDAFINQKNVSVRTKSAIKNQLKKIIEFYCIITNKTVDNEVLSYLENLENQKIKAQEIQNKTKLLPYSIMKPLVELLYKEFRNNKLDEEYRRYLALLYIETQTGIRPGELFMLENDCIVKQNALGKTLYQLRYKSTKGVRGDGYKIYMTLANEKVEEAVNFLKSFVYKGESLGAFLESKDLSTALKMLVDNHRDKFSKKELEEFGYNGYPIPYQFRVYFATELQRRGYNDMVVSKMLGHEDEKMWGYYARPADTIQEDWEYSKQIVQNIRHEDLKIMGAKGNVYEQKIKRFCGSKKINMKGSEEELIEEILNELPIRQKCGGFCIKPNSSRPCEMNNEEDSDSVLCAYEICPNQCHVYYDCVYYYNMFCMQKKVVTANLKGNFKNAAQKELFKLQNILNDRLIPELDELNNEIGRKGIDEILLKHPDLKDICDNMKEIMEDIQKWKNKQI